MVKVKFRTTQSSQAIMQGSQLTTVSQSALPLKHTRSMPSARQLQYSPQQAAARSKANGMLTGENCRQVRITGCPINRLPLCRGALIWQVAGTTGKVRLDGNDDEEGASTEEQGAAILAAFGYARRNEVTHPPFRCGCSTGGSIPQPLRGPPTIPP